MTLLFTDEGQVKHSPALLGIALASVAAALTSSHGILTYKSSDVINLTLPVAGIFAALALPAAQLAQSSVSDFLSAAQTLLKTSSPLPAIRSYLYDQAKQYRRDLNAARCAVLYSLASFFIAVAGMLGSFDDVSIYGTLGARDLIATVSVATLVVAVGWLIPVVNSAFSFATADRLLESLADSEPSAVHDGAPTKPPEAPKPATIDRSAAP
jgi:hypothetical protein